MGGVTSAILRPSYLVCDGAQNWRRRLSDGGANGERGRRTIRIDIDLRSVALRAASDARAVL